MKIKHIEKVDGESSFITINKLIREYNGITDWKLATSQKDKSMKDYIDDFERLAQASKFKEMIEAHDKKTPITIVGDYDCDGIMGSVILICGLSMLGYKTKSITPDRFKDGYGMQNKHVENIKNEMIITVDNGITRNEAIQLAKDNGNVVIVTDHHLPKKDVELPNADLIIDPWVDDTTEFKSISGATVAFKLIYELLLGKVHEYHLQKLATFAGITAMSDMMPMLGENRTLVKGTLDFITNEIGYFKQEGVDTTFSDICNMVGFHRYMPRAYDADGNEVIEDKIFKTVSKTTMDFGFIPVINSMNRVVGDCRDIVRDITYAFFNKKHIHTHDYVEINNKRKTMMKQILEFYTTHDSLVAVEPINFNTLELDYSGVVGLVSSDIVKREQKPAIVGIMKPGSEYVKFSGRSYGGFNLSAALDRMANETILDFTFGGHAEALGCAIHIDDIDDFREALSEIYSEYKVPEEVLYNLDGEDFFTWKNIYADMQPFGQNFTLPGLYSKATIVAMDLETKPNKFILKTNLESKRTIEVMSYDKDIVSYMKTLRFNAKKMGIDPTVEMVLEFMMDDGGEVKCKVERLIDVNQELMDKAIEDRLAFEARFKKQDIYDEHGFLKEE